MTVEIRLMGGTRVAEIDASPTFVIPRINETINLDGKKYVVRDVEHMINTSFGPFKNFVTLYCQCK